MPRLRSKQTGAVVSVDDDTAARLANRYEPVGGEGSKPEPKPAPKRRPATRKK